MTTRILFNKDGLVENLAIGVDMDAYAELIGGTIVIMISDRPSDRHQALMDGTWEIPKEVIYAELAEIERIWQTGEMAFIANQLLAIEEEAEDALPGTRSQWLSYRTKVRLWHESVNYPQKEKRPVRPS